MSTKLTYELTSKNKSPLCFRSHVIALLRFDISIFLICCVNERSNERRRLSVYISGQFENRIETNDRSKHGILMRSMHVLQHIFQFWHEINWNKMRSSLEITCLVYCVDVLRPKFGEHVFSSLTESTVLSNQIQFNNKTIIRILDVGIIVSAESKSQLLFTLFLLSWTGFVQAKLNWAGQRKFSISSWSSGKVLARKGILAIFWFSCCIL